MLRAGAPRREQLDELRQELAGRQEDIKVLDDMYDLTTVRPATQHCDNLHGGAPACEGVTSNHSMRLPTDLPKFRGNGDNPDIFIETLGKSLLAHDVDPSR